MFEALQKRGYVVEVLNNKGIYTQKQMEEMDEKVNETWEKYEYIKDNGDVFSIIALQRVMGIDSETQYNDWLEKWYKELANSVDMGFKWAPLKSRIFRDGELPVYGVAFKEHPEWTMDFTIEELR